MSNLYLNNSEATSMFHELNHWADNMTADPQESLDEICQSCFHRVRSWEVFCSRCGTMSTTFALFPPAAILNSEAQTVDETTPVAELGSESGSEAAPEPENAVTGEALGHGIGSGTITLNNALIQEAMGLLESLATMSPLISVQNIPLQIPDTASNSTVASGEVDHELEAELEAMLFLGEPGLEPEAVYGGIPANSNNSAIPLVPTTEGLEALPLHHSSVSQVFQDPVVNHDAHEVDSDESSDSSDDGSLFEERDDTQAVSPPAAFVELALPTSSRRILGDRDVPNSCTSNSDRKASTADVSRENAENIDPAQTLSSQEEPTQFFSEVDSGHAEWDWQNYHEGNNSQSQDMSIFQLADDFNSQFDDSDSAVPGSLANYARNYSEAEVVINASTSAPTFHEKEGNKSRVSEENMDFRGQERSDALPEGRVAKSKFKNTSTASLHANVKGKGKARQDVSNDEGTTPPSLEHFTFTFVADGPFAESESNSYGPEPGPSTGALRKRRKTTRAPRFPKSAETLGIGKIENCPYSSCDGQLSSDSALKHLGQHINSTRSGKCPKAGCSHTEKDNIQRLADHIMVKHFGFKFPCVVPQCPSTVSRRDSIRHHRTNRCHYCIFCGEDKKCSGPLLIEHEQECENATEEQRRNYLRELAESDEKKKSWKENKAQKK